MKHSAKTNPPYPHTLSQGYAEAYLKRKKISLHFNVKTLFKHRMP